MAFLKTEHLTFSYPAEDTDALKDVCIEVEKGSIALVFGPSGCGKSTLLRHLYPGIEPYGKKSGQIFLDGRELQSLDRREICERIGYVGQNAEAQVITDRVWHELSFTLENLGYDDTLMRSRIAEISSYFSIQDWLDRDTASLSGGEKQKLTLACGMLTFPDLLILDEPVSQLDPVMKEEFLQLVRRINEDFGTTVIMCEHDLSGALAMADECFLMEEGIVSEAMNRNEAAGLLIGSGYDEYLPQTVRAANRLFGIKEVLSVRDMKKLATGKSFSLTGRRTSETSDADAVNLRHVWFRYERKGRDIIRDLSLDIRKKDFVCLIGPNGSGKTTLLGIMSGALTPYRGKVRTSGRTAMLPQQPVSLFVKDTVREDFENISGKYMKYVERFSLENVLERHPYDLSGGEIELCAVIKVLLSDPDIIILDEPTKGMDAGCRIILGRMLEELNREGKTIILTTHDMEFCARFTARTSVIFDGDVVGFDDTGKVLGESCFYTTDMGRIFRGTGIKALLAEEVAADD